MNGDERKTLSKVLLFISLLSTASCAQAPEETARSPKPVLRLAVTTSAISSGLFDKIIPAFENMHPIKVEITAGGSGEALQSAREGSAGLVLVHAREAEDRFIAEGYGVNRSDVMYNEFILVGPPEDPLRVQAGGNLVDIFREIHHQGIPFLSRGDRSGTHIREQAIWRLTGIQPRGDWYRISKKGMGETLKMASDQKAYTLSDEGSYFGIVKLRYIC